jgi:hypothetical protein
LQKQKRGVEAVTLDTFCNPDLADLARREAEHARATFPHRTGSTYTIVYNVLKVSREARNDRRVLLEKVQADLKGKYRSPEGIFRRARFIQNDIVDKKTGKILRYGEFKPDIVSEKVREAEEESERNLARQTKQDYDEM